jgi:ribosomal protein S18 acetylase RimI-like enzyme
MDVSLRKLIQTDRPAIIRLLHRINGFHQDDIDITIELLDIFLYQHGQKEYEFLVAVNEAGWILGFICYGPTPLTDGTYDLYWIAVDPDYEGKGIGSRMFQMMEDCIRRDHGRLLIIETSSDPNYAAAQRFYLKCGCALAEDIHDFYHVGEDRLTYTKYLNK